MHGEESERVRAEALRGIEAPRRAAAPASPRRDNPVRRDEGGAHAQAAVEPQRRQVDQPARATHLRDAPVAARKRPALGLELPLYPALHVEAPFGEAGLVEQALDGNANLDRPPCGRSGGGRFPDRIPVRVLAPAQTLCLLGDQGVVARAVRIHGEHIARLLVEKRIEHDAHVIFGRQIGVARAGEARDPVRIRVVAANPEHEHVGVGQDLYDRALGRNGAELGLEFGQQGRIGRGPHRLAHAPVELDRLGERAHAEPRPIEILPRQRAHPCQCGTAQGG